MEFTWFPSVSGLSSVFFFGRKKHRKETTEPRWTEARKDVPKAGSPWHLWHRNIRPQGRCFCCGQQVLVDIYLMSIFPAKEVKKDMSYCKCSKSHTTARRIISISKAFLLCGLICLRRFVDFQSQPQIASEASMHLELLPWLSGPGHCTPCSALASSHLFPQWQPLPPWLGTC